MSRYARPTRRRDPVDSRTERLFRYYRRQGLSPTEALQRAKSGRTERRIGHVGDVGWPEYEGGPIYKTEHGYVLEYVIPPESERGKYEIYRVDLDRESLPSWVNAKGVASYIGGSPGVLHQRWRHPDPRVRASARLDVAGYHGWRNLDDYPLRLSKRETELRYRRRAS